MERLSILPGNFRLGAFPDHIGPRNLEAFKFKVVAHVLTSRMEVGPSWRMVSVASSWARPASMPRPRDDGGLAQKGSRSRRGPNHVALPQKGAGSRDDYIAFGQPVADLDVLPIGKTDAHRPCLDVVVPHDLHDRAHRTIENR